MPKASRSEKKASPKARKEFEFQSKTVYLTCAKWRKEPMANDEFRAWVLAEYVDDQEYVVHEWCFCQEEHKSGEWHYHGFMSFAARLKTRNPRFFDREAIDQINNHCRIESARSKKKVITYIQKTGPTAWVGNVDKVAEADPSTHYRRKRDDKAAFEEDKERAERKEIKYPIKLPWCEIPKPDAAIKKRHWWICGPPDIGKTFSFQSALGGHKVFLAGLSSSYRFEGYEHEDIVCYDDVLPSTAELIEVSNTWLMERERFGGSRYKRRYWKQGHTRTIVVLSNVRPATTDAFQARFNVVDMLPPDDISRPILIDGAGV